MDRTEVDAGNRASVTFRQFVPGLSNGNVETQIMHLPGDTIFDAIQNAFFNNTILLMALLTDRYKPATKDTAKAEPSAFLVCGDVLRDQLYRTAGVGRYRFTTSVLVQRLNPLLTRCRNTKPFR